MPSRSARRKGLSSRRKVMAARFATAAEVVGATGIAPGLAVLDPSLVDAWLLVAQAYIGLQAWGSVASTGHALLTAHFLVLQPEAAAVGVGEQNVVVTAESNGPSSRSFAVPSYEAGEAAFAGTMYGQQFIELRRAVLAASFGASAHGGPLSTSWATGYVRGLVWSR